MPEPASPFETTPPSGRRIATSVAVAVVAALVVLVTVILPAEYNIDPTGVGGAIGLTQINEPERTLVVRDVIGGNETYRSVPIPDFGQPVPLPNPAVFQGHAGPARTETLTVTLEPGEETEVKTVLKESQVIVYSWSVDRGQLYVDFHGHEPDAGQDYWVRYEEQQEGSSGHGSLVAPFAGEHGWFWQNYNEFPVVITLTFTGYFDDFIDYGKF